LIRRHDDPVAHSDDPCIIDCSTFYPSPNLNSSSTAPQAPQERPSLAKV